MPDQSFQIPLARTQKLSLHRPPGGNALQARVLSIVRQIDAAGDGRHRLKADEVARLAGRRSRFPHHGDGIFRAEHRLDSASGGRDGKMGAAGGVALQIDEAVIERAAFERQRRGQIHRPRTRRWESGAGRRPRVGGLGCELPIHRAEYREFCSRDESRSSSGIGCELRFETVSRTSRTPSAKL